MSVTAKDVDEAGSAGPDAYIAKYGRKRWDEVWQSANKVPSGSYDDKTLQKALEGLKKTP